MSDIDKAFNEKLDSIQAAVDDSIRDQWGLVSVGAGALQDVINELKKLQAENAELKKQSQWISVDDPPKVAESGNWVAVPVLCEDGYVRVYDFNVKSKKWMHGLDKVISKPVEWMPTSPDGE